MVDGTVYVI